MKHIIFLKIRPKLFKCNDFLGSHVIDIYVYLYIFDMDNLFGSDFEYVKTIAGP